MSSTTVKWPPGFPLFEGGVLFRVCGNAADLPAISLRGRLVNPFHSRRARPPGRGNFALHAGQMRRGEFGLEAGGQAKANRVTGRGKRRFVLNDLSQILQGLRAGGEFDVMDAFVTFGASLRSGILGRRSGDFENALPEILVRVRWRFRLGVPLVFQSWTGEVRGLI